MMQNLRQRIQQIIQALPGYRPSWFGLARIAAFAVITLWLLGKVLYVPDTPIGWDNVSSPANVFTMVRPMDDPRGFRRGDDPPERGRLRIVWISGSSTQVLYPLNAPNGVVTTNEFFPMFVTPALKKWAGRDVEILLYVLQAGVPLDKYYALLDAMSRPTDLIIYEVNPTYDFMPVTLSRRQHLAPSAVRRLPGDAMTWALASPMDAIGSLVQYRLPAIGDRWAQHQWMSDQLAIPVPKISIAPRTGPLSPAATIATTDSLAFWATYASKKGKGPVACGSPDAQGRSNWCTHIEAAFAAGMPFAQQGEAMRTERNIQYLIESKRPAIIYLAAVSKQLRDIPLLRQLYRDMGERIAQSAAKVASPTACVITDFPEKLAAEQEFQDAVHLKKSEPMASVFSDLIIRWMDKRQCSS